MMNLSRDFFLFFTEASSCLSWMIDAKYCFFIFSNQCAVMKSDEAYGTHGLPPFFPLHLYFSRPNCPNLCFKALKIWPSLSNNKTTMSNWNNVTSKPVENREEPWMESDLLTDIQENLSPCLQSQQPTDRWHCDAWSLNRKDRVSPENQRSCGVFSLQQSHLIILLVVTTDNSNALHMHDADDLRALQCLTHWCGLCAVPRGCYTCVGGILMYRVWALICLFHAINDCWSKSSH